MSPISSATLEQFESSGFVEKSLAQEKRMWRRHHNGSWLKSSSTRPYLEVVWDVVSIVIGTTFKDGSWTMFCGGGSWGIVGVSGFLWWTTMMTMMMVDVVIIV